jgi:hypothetical protein
MSARVPLSRVFLLLPLTLLPTGCGEAPRQDQGPAGATRVPPPASEVTPEAVTPEAAPEQAPVEPQVVPANGNGFRLEWSTEPSPPPLNGEFSVRFRLLGEDGAPLAAELSSLRVDADMPAHGHGMNVAPTLTEENGWVEATPLLFHMPGAWELYVDRTEGALTERAQVPFEVR